MAPPRPVSAAEIEPLAIGAWILGTGGGGSPYLALLNMRALYRQGARVSLLDPLDLADDDLVAVVSNMGAPLVGQERLTDPRTVARAVEMMEEYIGRRFRAIMTVEIGGGNALQPFMAAALLDRPVVDADALGRGLPPGARAELPHPRPAHVPAAPRRRARQRGDRRPGRVLEVDGAPLAEGVRRGRLDRLHVQGAAHGQGGQGVWHPPHDEQGHPPRRDRAGRPPRPP